MSTESNLGSTKAENVLKILEQKRNMMFAKMQQLYEKSKTAKRNSTSFIAAANNISTLRRDFIECVDRINATSFEIKDNFTPSYREVEAFDGLYDKVNEVLYLINQPPVPGERKEEERTTATGGGPANGPRLLPIQLPTFSGKLEEFPAFIELFNKLVHENTAYTNVERVCYLISHLSGAAKIHCSSILPTAENYHLILDALKKRFEDKRALLASYFEKLINFKPLISESEQSLDSFLSQFAEPVRAMKKMEVADLADALFVHIALKKLDPVTSKAFENINRSENEIPKFETLVSFITEQAKILSRSGSTRITPSAKSQNLVQPKPHVNAKNSQNFNYSLLASETPSPVNLRYASNSHKINPPYHKCLLCSNPTAHPLYECSAFKKMSVQDRWAWARKQGTCYNCLSVIHRSQDCRSTRGCQIEGCGQRHHSLLHRVGSAPLAARAVPGPSDIRPSGATPSANGTPSTSTQTFCSVSSPINSLFPSTVLLATVKVTVEDSHGRAHELRGILDPGSQTNFLTRKACSRLGIPQTPTQSVVKGIGNTPLNVSACATLNFASRMNSSYRYTAHVLLVEKLSDRIPTLALRKDGFSHLEGLFLADSDFHKPDEIEFLLGCEIWPALFGNRKIVGQAEEPVAIETTLGYVVMGRAAVSSPTTSPVCLFVENSLDSMVKKFWSLEEVPTKQLLSPEEIKCEEFFLRTYSRGSDGRFIVRLPFRLSPDLLGSSINSCVSRFISLERKFSREPALKTSYTNLIEEYLTDGTIRRLGKIGDINNEVAFYMPHHGVHRPTHPTTPLRIVFNASAPSSSSYSLNQLMFVGPKLQADIFEVLVHFRLYQYALTADIRRMFLQIDVAEGDRRYQRFIWRTDPAQPLQVYELNKVVFGNASSPYLANRVVRMLASLEESNYPLAADVAKRDVYVDDIATSVSSFIELKELYSQLRGMFSSAGFQLSKWASNSLQMVSEIPLELRLMSSFEFDQDQASKVLGVKWSPKSDQFSCTVDVPVLRCTKRNILSVTARIFDPLGLVAPVTLMAKLLIRRLWQDGCGWDEMPAPEVVSEWEKFKTALPLLKTIAVPRHSGVVHNAISTLVGFSDSSSKAYGGCIFVHTEVPGQQVSVRLLCAKSRVAPQKTLTIPRLELCGALLLSNLMHAVINAYAPRYEFENVVAFTDSRVVLQWIRSDPAKWKVFVGNRIAQIHENLSPDCWQHISGKENPADVLSRGTSPAGLIEHPLWFTGPEWLATSRDSWPVSSNLDAVVLPESEEKVSVLMATTLPDNVLLPLLDRISSFRKLLRATAYIFRICKRKYYLKTPYIMVEELKCAERYWIQCIQRDAFGGELACLERGMPVSTPLRHLDPMLRDGILRVGGRLQNSKLRFEEQHPVLLPSKGKFVELLIDQFHIDLLHAGAHVLLANLRQQYWIPSARTLVRSRVHKCNICYRTRPKPTLPKMAPLPDFRIQDTRVFDRVGVDYAGPFQITPLRRRGQRTLTKAYFCIFICLEVKAIHLELVSDLSTEMFLAAFKRFLSRRGPTSLILSDGGTNFVGARRQLEELDEFLASKTFQTSIGGELSARGTKWRINPPNGPWFGGIWESNIRSVKGHIQRIVGKQILTYEEFNTVIIQVEAILNSRPLCVLSGDPSSPAALTPAHFLTVGASLGGLPARAVEDVPINRLHRYQLMDRMVQEFWRRWRQEYLQTLQSRSKWTEESTPIERGTVVVIMKDNVPPLQWPLGIVEEIHPGTDGVVRVVDVRTTTGTYRRPVGRVCPLPTQ